MASWQVVDSASEPSQGGDTGSNPVGTTRNRPGQGPCPVPRGRAGSFSSRFCPAVAANASSGLRRAARALPATSACLGSGVSLDLPGVGTDVAGALLVAAGDNPERLSSEAAFARLCGVAPLPASSGKTNRHRLNRGGARIANNALWRIVLVRMSSDPRTRNYVERRTKEGLSKKEIIRCLKRYVAREVYRRLVGVDEQ